LLVLNNFGNDEKHLKLATITFQSLFPMLNVQKIKLSECKRVVLLNYDKETERIEFRHYLITVNAFGVSKSIKRVIQSQIPNLSDANDISEYVLRGTQASESDIEDGPDSTVELAHDYNKKNLASQNSAVRLIELGPRMQLQLIKIQEGFATGEVLYHKFIEKTTEEIEHLKLKKEAERELKEQRKNEQEQNVKKKSINTDKDENDEDNEYETKFNETYEDNDADWYREEVGEEPDAAFFTATYQPHFKKRKFNNYKKNNNNKEKPSFKRKEPSAGSNERKHFVKKSRRDD